MYRGELSVRRVWALIAHLGEGSALHRVAFPEHAAWSLSNHLLAEILHGLRISNWQRAGNDKVDPPPPIVRPGVVAPEASRERRAREYLERQRQRETG